jgi:hypothetical protein
VVVVNPISSWKNKGVCLGLAPRFLRVLGLAASSAVPCGPLVCEQRFVMGVV